ncbi:MAG: translocation/assembly module TamB domain-containing protein, partial [Spirochaetales bacterium]|nr:translocation/assembly module TamB domain-containing protein [Candidatus Physcosoma equi]
TYAGILKAENMDLSIVGINGMVGNANLAGRAAMLRDFTFTGNIDAEPTDLNNDSRKLTGRISIDATSLSVENVRFTNTGLDLSIPTISYDSISGNYAMKDMRLFLKGEHKDRDYPIDLKLQMHGNLTEQDSLYSAVFNLMRSRGEGVSLGVDLQTLSIDNSQLLILDKTTKGVIQDGVLRLEGNMASGELNLNDFSADLELDVMPLAKLGLSLDFKDGLEGKVRLDGFNMYVMNLFFDAPLLVFKENYVMGDIGIKKQSDGFNLNGNLTSDELSLEIFWAPDQLVTLHNPKFTIWDNDIRTSMTPTTILNYDDYSRIGINMIIGFGFTPSLSFEGYDAEIFVNEGDKLKVRIPLPDTNVDILGYVNGHYKFTGYDGRVTNDGYLNLMDTEIFIGMNPYPEWYGLTGDMFIDLDFNFARNNVIKYPAGPNPMVSIVIADNTDLFFHLGHDGIKCTGDLALRGGEIFYFQKYFYVVDGNIHFDNPEKLDPQISLRAALRDYDKNGNKVEIYLVMKDNTFDNISPTFESAPQMEISEIMDILGQSILSSSTYGTVSVSSMASLVTESVDVLSKLGIIEQGNTSADLNSSLKKALHLDTFSLHTNIVNNIVTDTISNAAFEGIETFTPMARYLNGTTLNIGKYLTPSLYLQARINLDAKKDRHAYTLFADDLVLDTEISLEWTTPAFEVTFFSTPKYLSFYSFMQTFGFTIKKTFKF